MSYMIRVYMGQQIKDISLTNTTEVVTIGSADFDTLKVPFGDIAAGHLSFRCVNGVWCCQDNQKNTSKEIKDGDTFVLSMQNRVAAAIYSDDIIPQRVKLKTNSTIVIGRDFECMFHLPDRSVGRKHAEIRTDELGVTLRDLDSLNGTYVNNRKINEQSIKDGDIISIGKYNILFKNSTLELCTEQVSQEKKISKVEKKVEYPVFSLSPRLRHKAPSEVIEIQAPPNIGNMPMVNWLSFLPMLATRSPYAAVFPLTSVFSTFLQKKKYKKAQEVRQEKYENYLADVKAKIDKNRDDQFLSLEESNHETSRCYDIATRRERTLWERTPEDDDFMKVRIGKGDIQTSFQIKFPDSVLKLYNDELEGQGEELGRGNQLLEGAPILCDLFNDLSVGVIGNRKKAITVARNMIIQLATTHSYKDLKIVSLFNKKEASEWEFVKWLPHSFNDSREIRYVANDVFNASTLEKIIDEELKDRKLIDLDSDSKKANKLPFYLFVVSDPEMIDESEIENYLDGATAGAGIGVIYVYNELKQLPKTCNIIVDIQREQNEVFHKSNVGEKQKFDIDTFSAEKAEALARSLAPVRLAEKKSVADMPTCVTFLEGYGVKKVEELPIWENWNNTNPSKSITVPLGVKANGEPFMFNIMYGPDFMRYHGSHGLVAGATRSGKSEMVQSWILSLASRFSPEEISFVIIDYKGTGMLLPFENLPHLAGKISNIDGNVKRNIIAINQEIRRRQLLFDRLGIKPEIKEYFAKGYHKTVEPMPAIIVVVDEFAEVKKNLPEFIPVLESLFAVGSALGIWVVLATQKPSGVVTDKMYANANFRWCCRVASSGDSKEMLHHTDAAKIKNAGRAYVQVGEDDIYEQVQSFWSGAPYLPDRTEKLSADLPISLVDITGKKVQYEVYKTEKNESATKEIDAVVEYIRKIADENNVPNAPKVWQERLDNRIYVGDLMSSRENDDFIVPYGMIDNPYSQSQYTAEINFTSEGHHLVYGAPGSGKTTFLQTCVMSIAKNYSPNEVNIYALDFGSWSLNLFSKLPHMGGVANDNDEEKINKLISMISEELDTRKKNFSMNGIINIKAYNQTADEKYPYIVLMIDNFSSVFSLYPGLDSFFIKLAREGASYGIYLLATTGTNGGVSYKVTANIKSNIALQMKDKSDYASVVGKTDGLEPENTEGRGLVKGNPFALEFQTALPAYGHDDNEVLENIKSSIQELSEKYSNYQARMIPIMPEIIPYNSVSGTGMTMGLSVKDVTPVELNIHDMPHYMVVSATPNSGATNLLKVIVKQFYEKENAKVVLYDNGSDELMSVRNISDQYIKSVEEFDDYIESLAQELKRRKNALSEGDEKFETILIAVDGYKTMFEAMDDKTADRLSALVRMGKGLKVFLVVAEDSQNMSMLCAQEPIMKNIVDDGIGLLVGGSFYSHTVFKSDLKYLESNEPLGEFEAFMVRDGKATKFKIMHEF